MQQLGVNACMRCGILLLARVTTCPLCQGRVDVEDEGHTRLNPDETRFCLICGKQCTQKYCCSSHRTIAHLRYKADPVANAHLAPTRRKSRKTQEAIRIRELARSHCNPLPIALRNKREPFTNADLVMIAAEGDDATHFLEGEYMNTLSKALNDRALDPLLYLDYRSQRNLPRTEFIEYLIERSGWKKENVSHYFPVRTIKPRTYECVCTVCGNDFTAMNPNADICTRCI